MWDNVIDKTYNIPKQYVKNIIVLIEDIFSVKVHNVENYNKNVIKFYSYESIDVYNHTLTDEVLSFEQLIKDITVKDNKNVAVGDKVFIIDTGGTDKELLYTTHTVTNNTSIENRCTIDYNNKPIILDCYNYIIYKTENKVKTSNRFVINNEPVTKTSLKIGDIVKVIESGYDSEYKTDEFYKVVKIDIDDDEISYKYLNQRTGAKTWIRNDKVVKVDDYISKDNNTESKSETNNTFKVGDYIYAEKSDADYRNDEYIPVFKVNDISHDKDWLRPEKHYTTGVHKNSCRLATQKEIDKYENTSKLSIAELKAKHNAVDFNLNLHNSVTTFRKVIFIGKQLDDDFICGKFVYGNVYSIKEFEHIDYDGNLPIRLISTNGITEWFKATDVLVINEPRCGNENITTKPHLCDDDIVVDSNNHRSHHAFDLSFPTTVRKKVGIEIKLIPVRKLRT